MSARVTILRQITIPPRELRHFDADMARQRATLHKTGAGETPLLDDGRRDTRSAQPWRSAKPVALGGGLLEAEMRLLFHVCAILGC